MNPYEADPQKIPTSDQYKAEPLFGRYHPQPGDFRPDLNYIQSSTPEALKYWEGVLADCNEENRIYENDDERGRDVFALGGVIVKSSHLKEWPTGSKAFRNYSYADANEKAAVALVRANIPTLQVPNIYFADKIQGRDILVQERLPGVALCVAWQYLDAKQKQSFKERARCILRQLQSIKPGGNIRGRTYLVPDNNPVEHRAIQQSEQDMIFSSNYHEDGSADLAFAHNDVSLSNLIVDNDKIVGLVDWEMAGFFGWEIAQAVHVRFRSPRREDFGSLDLPPDRLDDMLFWNDLYSEGQAEPDRIDGGSDRQIQVSSIAR